VLAWVTGATGFVGRALVERLAARGDTTIVALVRPASRHRVPAGVSVVAEGILPDTSALSALPRPDVVFHAAAVIDGDEAEGRAVHVEGTLRLAEAARGARFVHVSTTDVLPISSQVPVSESTPCAPHDAYGRTKLEADRRLLALRPDAIVLRPPGIYGPRGTRDVVLHIAERILRGTFFHAGDGSALRSWIFVETLVDAMLHASQRTELAGVYLVDDGRPVSRRELAGEITRVLGRKAQFPNVPVSALRMAAWALEGVVPRVGLKAPLTSASVRYATTSLILDTTRWKETGFLPRFTLEEAIRITLQWGRKTGRLGA
jgi:nucleoside-diphosphate-sugar epimerase